MALRALSVATDPDLVAGSVLSPATGRRAEVALADVLGPGGLSGDATALLGLSSAVTAAARGYRDAEAAATRAVELAQDTVMLVVGGLAPEIVVGVLALDALGVDVAGLLDQAVFDQPGVADLAGGAEGLVLGLRSNPLSRRRSCPHRQGRQGPPTTGLRACGPDPGRLGRPVGPAVRPRSCSRDRGAGAKGRCPRSPRCGGPRG